MAGPRRRSSAIRTKCPSCGRVEVEPSVITLALGPTLDQGSFSFLCPACSARVSQPATRRTLAVLMASGARLAQIEALDEAALPFEDRAPDPDAPPLTLDDLIDLHFLLQGDFGLGDVLHG